MLIVKARKTIEKYAMCKPGDTVVVGVSGGVDSVVTLHALAALRKELGIDLVVAHLNHNLRGMESERDLAFVSEVCDRHAVAFESKTLEPNELTGQGEGSMQQRARQARFEFFGAVARKHKARRVALGHNLDDQAETVLMRFIKGCGLKGLRGMEPVRDAYIRPLIEIERREIEDFANANSIGFVEDATNFSKKYLRNRIRLDLIPAIEADYNPSLKKALSNAAAIASKDYEFISNEARKVFPGLIASDGPDRLVLERRSLLALPQAISVRVYLQAIETIAPDFSELYAPHIDALISLLDSEAPNASIDLAHGLKAIREYDRIIILKESQKPIVLIEKDLAIPGRTEIGHACGAIDAEIIGKGPRFDDTPKTVALFDYDSIARPIRVRHWRPGDRLRPLGMEGHKKLKELFCEQKVPRAKREAMPIVEAGGEILWVAGIRQGEAFKVAKTSVRVLKLEWLLPNEDNVL